MPTEREIEAAAREILWWRRCDGASREEFDQSFDLSLEQWRVEPDRTPGVDWAMQVATDALEAAEAVAWSTDMDAAPLGEQVLVKMPEDAGHVMGKAQVGLCNMTANGHRCWVVGGMFAHDAGMPIAWRQLPALPKDAPDAD